MGKMKYDHLLDLHNCLRALHESGAVDDPASQIDCIGLQKARCAFC